jgi:hypothetical protein
MPGPPVDPACDLVHHRRQLTVERHQPIILSRARPPLTRERGPNASPRRKTGRQRPEEHDPEPCRAQPHLPQRRRAHRPAALEGSRDHVYQAALLDPNTAAALTVSQTVAMVDELLAAHAPMLPARLK